MYIKLQYIVIPRSSSIDSKCLSHLQTVEMQMVVKLTSLHNFYKGVIIPAPA